VPGCALQLIDECVAAGMLQARPERLEFRHELERMAVENSVAPGRRLQLHQRTLTALMARPETAQDHARPVHHPEGAGDAAAVLALAVPAGARAAALGAHRVAAAQYARASQLTARLAARDAAELLQQHAYECYLTNHLDEAAASQRKALTH
jgi:hypothetical protein